MANFSSPNKFLYLLKSAEAFVEEQKNMELVKAEEARLAADLKAKQEAEAKSAAELKAKQEKEQLRLALNAANPKAGAKCSKAKQVKIYKGKSYTCKKSGKKSGKKLVWKGNK
jgi:hypothetical protein